LIREKFKQEWFKHPTFELHSNQQIYLLSH
jgi:hypothetical protein